MTCFPCACRTSLAPAPSARNCPALCSARDTHFQDSEKQIQPALGFPNHLRLLWLRRNIPKSHQTGLRGSEHFQACFLPRLTSYSIPDFSYVGKTKLRQIEASFVAEIKVLIRFLPARLRSPSDFGDRIFTEMPETSLVQPQEGALNLLLLPDGFQLQNASSAEHREPSPGYHKLTPSSRLLLWLYRCILVLKVEV